MIIKKTEYKNNNFLLYYISHLKIYYKRFFNYYYIK